MANKRNMDETTKASARADARSVRTINAIGTGNNHGRSSAIVTNPGDNTKYIKHSLRLSAFPKMDVNNEYEVQKRILDYFDICAEDDMKPSVPGLALIFGLGRQSLMQIINGSYPRCKNSTSIELLQRAYNMLDLQMNNYLTDGKVNPVAGIFLMKNHFNYADKTEVAMSNELSLGTESTAKQLEDKYLSSMGQIIDTDVKDVTAERTDSDE